MHTVVLKQLNDSVIVEVPADLLELHAKAGQPVRMRVDESGVALAALPAAGRRLQELLDGCDFSVPMTDEEQEWTSSPAMGRDVL